MNRLETICAIVMLLLSATIIAATAELTYWDEFAPGSAFLPYWVAGLGAALALAMLAAAVRRKTDTPVAWPNRDGARRVILTAAGLWLLVAMLPWLGTAISISVFMLGLLLIVQKRKLVPSLAAAALTLALVESVFVLWLNIRLPRGPLGF